MAEQYQDDLSILADTILWRRVPPGKHWVVFDDNQKRWRPSSAAFSDHPNGSPMSVSINVGQAPASILVGLAGFAIASVTAQLVRECNQGIAPNPTDADPNHAEVFGRKTDSVRGRLAKASAWVVPPDMPEQP